MSPELLTKIASRCASDADAKLAVSIANEISSLEAPNVVIDATDLQHLLSADGQLSPLEIVVVGSPEERAEKIFRQFCEKTASFGKIVSMLFFVFIPDDTPFEMQELESIHRWIESTPNASEIDITFGTAIVRQPSEPSLLRILALVIHKQD